MRKIVSILLAIVVAVPIDIVKGMEDPAYPIPEDYVEPIHYYSDEEIELLSSQSDLIPHDDINVIIPVDPGQGATDCSALTNDQMGMIFSIAAGNAVVVKEMHNGTYCYKFVLGNDIMYIPASFLYKTSSGTCSRSTFNNTMTNRVNSSNTNVVPVYVFCSFKFYDNNNNVVYRYNVTKINGQIDIASGINMYTTLEVLDSVAFDVYANFINCVSTYTSNLKVKPTITLKITNTGGQNKSLYFGGYSMEGKGENSSTTNISTLVDLGIKTYELYASAVVNHDPYATFQAIYDLGIALIKGSSEGRFIYNSIYRSLSNPADNVYAYNCKTETPFYLKKSGDCIQENIALSEPKINSSRFAVSVSFYITH
ncbi:MAG: hypothetical protein IJS38_00785 [Erysipelotrichaceae bacterium]|nr:hypothetical protein [Erysipelotrichaceae bacterium]